MVSSFNINASNSISTALLKANSISTNTLQNYGAIKSDSLNVSTISSYYNYMNYISAGSISSGSIAVSLLSSGLLIGSSLSTNNIATNFISTGLLTANSISSVNAYASLMAGSSILANSISSGLITVNSISSVNINASIVSSALFIGSSVSTNALAANTISSGLLRANNISSLNINASIISSGLFIGSSVSTNVLAVNTLSSGVINAGNINGTIVSSSLFIGTSVSTNALAANTISTGLLNVNSISSVNLQATTISSSGLLANNILTNNISSINAKTSSITLSSIIIQSGTVAGRLSASSDGTLLLFNSASVGAWNGSATTALTMNGYPINASNINVSSLNTSINVNTSNLSGVGQIALTRSVYYSAANNSYIGLSNYQGFLSYGFGSNFPATTPVASDWWRYVPAGTVNLNNNVLSNVNTIYLKNGATQGSVTVNSAGNNLLFNGAPLSGGWVPTATSDLNMALYSISNITTNYTYNFSNTSVVPSLIAAAPQTFCAAINDKFFDATYTLVTTGSESNYLYFEPSQYMWNINITVHGTVYNDAGDTFMKNYFTLSNSANGEVPLTLYNSKRTNYTQLMPTESIGISYVSFSISDTVNLSNLFLNTANQAEIKLNMYNATTNKNNFVNTNISTWTQTNANLYGGCTAIAFGNNTFVVAGGGGISASYDNGATWIGAFGQGFTPYAIAYGNGTWVFGSDSPPHIFYSTDLTSFPNANYGPSLGFSGTCFSIAYGVRPGVGPQGSRNSLFVAIGSSVGTNIYYSYDGITWQAANGVNVGICTGGTVTYGSGHFIAVFNRITDYNNIYTSSDGINWSEITTTNMLQGYSVAYGNNNWLIYGLHSGSPAYDSLISSTDLSTWEEPGTAPPLKGFLLYGDTLVGGGGIHDNGHIYQSSDNGASWITVNHDLEYAIVAAYGNGTYIVGGSDPLSNGNDIVVSTGGNAIYFTLQPSAIQPIILTAGQ